ncbi:hypothetical protein R1flu_010057 [Riccia fluitans]|uniref:Polymerase nucleotidyl transferase domain-containing protein n=1 Tax=Riccia fluitans TaxID=41844 RepID=A0ABD1Z4P4_9MARC
MKIAREVRASSSKGRESSIRSKNQLLAGDTSERLRGFRGSLSDSEVDQFTVLARKSAKGSSIAAFLSGLQALKELSESGLLRGNFEDFSSVREAETSRLFDSTLKVAHTLSDRVLRKVRNLLVKIRNDHVEMELFGDENSGNLRSNNLDQKREVKSGKTKKKKRRKQGSSQKAESVQKESVQKESVQKEDNLPVQKGELVQKKDELCTVAHTSLKVQEYGEETTEVEIGKSETWISDPPQVMDLVKMGPSGHQALSRKGKSGKSQIRRDERLRHDSKLESKVLHVTDVEGLTLNEVGKEDLLCRSANEKVKDEKADQASVIETKKLTAEQYRGLSASDVENENEFRRKSTDRKGKRGKSKCRREQKQLGATFVDMTESRLDDIEECQTGSFSAFVNVSADGQGDRKKSNQDAPHKLSSDITVPSCEDIEVSKDSSLPKQVKVICESVMNGDQVWVNKVESLNRVPSAAAALSTHQHCSGPVVHKKMIVLDEKEESHEFKSESLYTLPSNQSETSDTSVSKDLGRMNLAQLGPEQMLSDSLRIKSSQIQAESFGDAAVNEPDSQEPPTICFGSFDTLLPGSGEISGSSHGPVTPMKIGTQASFVVKKGRELGDNSAHHDSRRAQVKDLGNWSEGATHSRHIRGTSNGPHPATKTSRQLEFAASGVLPEQQGSVVRTGPHEWPGSVQVSNSGACNQSTASDWLQLDVGRGLPPRVQSSRFSNKSNSLSVWRTKQADTSSSGFPSTCPSSTVNQEWPSFVQSINVPRNLPRTFSTRDEAKFTGRCSPKLSKITSGSKEVKGSSETLVDDVEDKFAYDTDVDDYGDYKTGEFDDFDGYLVSEEEGDKSLDDGVEGSAADYNQIFGGGVMYWNSADYAGMGYSRPGSLSSEDSSWARHEADLSVVLDDIVNCQLPQSGYPGKGSAVLNGISSSPPSASSLPVNFDYVNAVASSNSRHGLPRPVGNEFGGKITVQSSQLQSPEEQSALPRELSSEMIEKSGVDSSAQPVLRPIVVVRDFILSRQVTSGEALRLQEAKSPHIVPRSKRDFPSHRRRPPSPVLRCVPPAPPPPPPSPVAGPRRRKGFMAARSGSSSPRHWGLVNWSHKDEADNTEGNSKGGNQEGFIAGGRRRSGVINNPPMHPLSGALLRERLIAVPSLSLEQEHPDLALPMKTTLIQTNNPALYHSLTKMMKIIHVEIEAFRVQVLEENKRRRPFVHTAVKKVAHSLQVLWPRSRTKIFGSIATGLALPTSDVDLVVCLPPVRNLEPIKEAGILEGRNGIKETCLQHAARYLADQEWVKSDSLKTVENTLVPIISLIAEFHNQQFEMDDEESSFFHSSNLRKYASRESEVRGDSVSTVTVVPVDRCKEDKNSCDEEVKGSWGGEADRRLVRLDISFEAPSHTGLRTAELVRELIGQFPALSPMALVLKQFLTDRSLDHPYTGGLGSYCLVLLITRFLQHQSHLQSNRQSSSQNLGSLLVDFLHFFGCVFDPRSMGVRIRSGGMFLSRDNLNRIDPLYIEDPLHAHNNIGRNCFRIQQCVKAFAEAYAVLEKRMEEWGREHPRNAYDVSTWPGDALGARKRSNDWQITKIDVVALGIQCARQKVSPRRKLRPLSSGSDYGAV